MFRNIPEEEALGTVNAAWDQGIRYFDTAPFYGAGLSEIRMGKVLSRHKRDDYVLSTKVGRIILNEIETGSRQFGEKGDLFASGRANKIVYDYTEKGAMKSIQGSLQRLGVERLDVGKDTARSWIEVALATEHVDEAAEARSGSAAARRRQIGQLSPAARARIVLVHVR